MSVSQEELDAENSLKKMVANFGVRSFVIMNDAGSFGLLLWLLIFCVFFSSSFPHLI
jgi:hypothetical protein